jgi:hypothetical protein
VNLHNGSTAWMTYEDERKEHERTYVSNSDLSTSISESTFSLTDSSHFLWFDRRLSPIATQPTFQYLHK